MTVAEFKAAMAEYMLNEKTIKTAEAVNEIPDEESQKMIDENRSVKEAAQGVFFLPLCLKVLPRSDFFE